MAVLRVRKDTGRAVTEYLWDCIYCGFPTNHVSQTCIAHRDLAPPIPGLDEPYLDELHSPDDIGRNPGDRAARRDHPGRREAGLSEDR